MIKIMFSILLYLMLWYKVCNSAINSVDPLLILQILWTFSIAWIVVFNSSLFNFRECPFLAGISHTLAA